MRLSCGLFLSFFTSIVWASLKLPVYIFHEHEVLSPSEIPILSPRQARLVLAQRLGVSNYHELGDVSDSTLSYINKFGRKNSFSFENSNEKIADLVLVVKGRSSEAIQLLTNTWPNINPDFQISYPTFVSNALLSSDFQGLTQQIENGNSLKTAIDPNKSHWHGNSKDALELLKEVFSELRNLFDRREVNTAVIFVPETQSSSESNLDNSSPNEKILVNKKRTVEKSMISSTFSLSSIDQLNALNSSIKKLKPLLPICFSSLETCISSTKNCSGHGECTLRSGERDKGSECFTCKCRATNETILWAKGSKKGWKIGYWGGSACHKEDISSSFWLVSIFTIVMIGVITWAISMLFSIGEESLPGVIGAGVSGGKLR
ncbi:hypothetical protein HI914_00332 [Erysiphe necator]|nr:hypothetical protein HI914_00332 [Erysiphe necator]